MNLSFVYLSSFERTVAGSLTDDEMRQVAPPPPYDSARIRAIRARLRLSQRLFATALNVSERTVQAGEQGVRRPDRSARRQLEMADKHPNLLTATGNKPPAAT